MAIAALSPNSVLATPVQVNPQVKTEQQNSMPQVADNSQKSVKTVQTDTITISPQALKMADHKNDATKETTKKDNDQQALQLASNKSAAANKITQRNAATSFSAVS